MDPALARSKPFAALMLLLIWGCALPIRAQEIRRSIEPMNFRPVSAEDPLLDKPFKNEQAFYSIRPPAGWAPQRPGPLEKSLRYAVHFENPQNGDFLSIGLLEGGPQSLTLAGLSRFRGDYLGSIRKSGMGRIIGSDLFQFGHHLCLQVLVQNKDHLVLQLLVFDQPGSFAQLVFSMGKNRYRPLARALEASIASFEWPAI